MERNLSFDEIVERKNTGCLKYDFAVKRGKPEELKALGDICRKYGVIVVSDEIHSDFVFGDKRCGGDRSFADEYHGSCRM